MWTQITSLYTVVKLTIAQLIVGTDLGTTEKSPPDALKSGNTGENLAPAARNQMGATP